MLAMRAIKRDTPRMYYRNVDARCSLSQEFLHVRSSFLLLFSRHALVVRGGVCLSPLVACVTVCSGGVLRALDFSSFISHIALRYAFTRVAAYTFR